MKSARLKSLLEMILVLFLVMTTGPLMNLLGNSLGYDGLWLGVASYGLSMVIVLFMVRVVDHSNLSEIGLRAPRTGELLAGLGLGVAMFIIQQIPLLLMGFDYRVLAVNPDWGSLVSMSIFCLLCVGVVEELIFRGYLLHKSQTLLASKTAVVVLNCLLFYVYHWPPIRFVFGEFFNISVNTILLCVFLYRSKGKSLLPLMLAHGVYDLLIILLPAAIFYLT